MVKYILLGFAVLFLMACSDQPTKTVYLDKYIPVYVVPKPPKVEKPALVINTLTEDQKNNIGELVKAYTISLKQTMQYACKLKNIVDKYDELSAFNPSLITPIPISLSPFSLTGSTVLNQTGLNVDVAKDCINP